MSRVRRSKVSNMFNEKISTSGNKSFIKTELAKKEQEVLVKRIAERERIAEGSVQKFIMYVDSSFIPL